MTGTPLRVLTYHRVLDPAKADGCNPASISATPDGFDAQMRQLARHYDVVSANDVIAAQRPGGRLPRRPVLITFDDACRDFNDVAWPILRRYGLSATLFVPTAYPDRPDLCFWWDRLSAAFTSTRLEGTHDPALGPLRLHTPKARQATLRGVQRQLKTLPHLQAMHVVDRLCAQLGELRPPSTCVLAWNELRRLAGEGVVLGAHTRTHPALTRLPADEARAEIRGSRDDLWREAGVTPRVFAYPFGDHDEAIVRLVREEGFDLALTCVDGHNPASMDPLRLRRTNISRRTTPAVFRFRLTPLGAHLDRLRHRAAVRSERRGGRAVPAAARETPSLKVAYIMSRFPKLSETFILNEILTVASLGVPIEVYPLLRERQRTVHPEVVEWVRRAHFHRLLSFRVLHAHAHFLLSAPAEYVTVATEVFRRTWGSTNFFIGALGTFPKAVRFAYEMRRTGVTHVHAHFATHPALAAFIIHRLTGIPFSFTAHGSDLHVDRRMLDAKVEAAAFAVAVSAFNKEVMVRECGERNRAKIHVVHCGVDPECFAPLGRFAHGGQFRIVCVASFEAVKGHRYLIEACRILRDRGMDLRCDLVGDGPLRHAVELQITQSGLGKRVRILGGRPRPDVVRLLASADVAVLASHPTPDGKREGIPVALMEAMASGLPVVASAISGIPELVESGVTGILVPSGDPAAIAAALDLLAADRAQRERMAQAGRDKVLREFNLQTNTRQLLTLFSATPAPHRVEIPAGMLLGHD